MVYLKKYGDAYYAKHKDDILKKTECLICGGKYNANSKWTHEQTKKHQFSKKMLESTQCIKKENIDVEIKSE